VYGGLDELKRFGIPNPNHFKARLLTSVLNPNDVARAHVSADAGQQSATSANAATVASGGFFDVDNVPAWETWLYFDGKSLLSWVPPRLISKVQFGIDVNPEGCIKWAR
jgi:hypothetical protein